MGRVSVRPSRTPGAHRPTLTCAGPGGQRKTSSDASDGVLESEGLSKSVVGRPRNVVQVACVSVRKSSRPGRCEPGRPLDAPMSVKFVVQSRLPNARLTAGADTGGCAAHAAVQRTTHRLLTGLLAVRFRHGSVNCGRF